MEDTEYNDNNTLQMANVMESPSVFRFKIRFLFYLRICERYVCTVIHN